MSNYIFTRWSNKYIWVNYKVRNFFNTWILPSTKCYNKSTIAHWGFLMFFFSFQVKINHHRLKLLLETIFSITPRNVFLYYAVLTPHNKIKFHGTISIHHWCYAWVQFVWFQTQTHLFLTDWSTNWHQAQCIYLSLTDILDQQAENKRCF